MILLSLLFLFRQQGTTATPIAPSLPVSAVYDATLIVRNDTTNVCPGRSVWDIVWSCLATTFAVTWVSVHPNVPFLEESSWHLLKRRIFLMCLALLAPEVMVMWAFKQWRGAVMIMENMNNASRQKNGSLQWTMIHAHFLQMGGFKVNYLSNEKYCSYWRYSYSTLKKGLTVQESFLTFYDLRELFDKQLIDFPDTTAKEIEDRSKSNAFSKGIALLQISWFLIQLVARANQNLDITEIELTTAALAGLNSVMYLFWWNKPFDVRCPIVIRTKELERRLVEAKRVMDEKAIGTVDEREQKGNDNADGCSSQVGEDEVEAGGQGQPVEDVRRISQMRTVTVKAVDDFGDYINNDFALTKHLMTTARRVSNTIRTVLHLVFLNLAFFPHWLYDVIYATQISNNRTEKSATLGILGRIWMCRTCPVTKLVYLPWLLVILPIDQILRPGLRLRPILFCDAKNYMNKSSSLRLLFDKHDMAWIMSMMFRSEYADTKPLLIFSALAGAAFGLIHCAAWSFNFPSTVEQVLWRTASLTIIGFCLCVIAGIPLYNCVLKHWLDGHEYPPTKSHTMWMIAKNTMETAPAIIYPLARVSLLILSFMSLRTLSSSALDTVNWTKSIPHL